MNPRKLELRVGYWISIACIVVFLFSHVVLGQGPSASSKSISGGQQGQDSSVLLEYARSLQEENKAHREYLEKLYTVTSTVLAFLVAVGVAVIGYAQFKTRKDVEDAVNARFNATVDKEIQRRLTQFTDQLNEFEQILNALRDDAGETKKTLQDVRLLAADTRSLVEDKPAEPPAGAESRTEAEVQEGATEQPPAAALDGDEREILESIGMSKYSLRTQGGVIQEAALKRIDADRTIRSLQTLTQKGFIGETLGKTGGKRWYVTETGRKLLIPSVHGQV